MRPALLLLALPVACSSSTPVTDPPPYWTPGAVYVVPTAPNARGLLDRRGLIHSHSYFSHDACDGQPILDGGQLNEPCFEDFRRGLCQSGHDFDFLTDHPRMFGDHDFPDTLLYRSERGDQLVDHGAGPTANWASCPNGAKPVLVMAGTESPTMMPVGLEAQVPGRNDVYDSDTPEALEQVKAAGAVALIMHTELWNADQLTTLPIDGFEMYNLHANTFKNAGLVADWLLAIDAKNFDGLPDPNLFLTGFKLEDDRYLTTWGTTLARGVKRVTTMGTDCHRNTFPDLAQDGERLDSYRRMMVMFSNHLLVKPKPDGSWDDRDLKAALRAGRLYGSFDFMGYPEGFDFFALQGEQLYEMGSEVRTGAVLKVAMPAIQRLNPAWEAPYLTLHLYKAIEGGWSEVANGTGSTLSFTTVDPGAYRAEVRIIPKHLKGYMGRRRDLAKDERPWVYSNAIYVK